MLLTTSQFVSAISTVIGKVAFCFVCDTKIVTAENVARNGMFHLTFLPHYVINGGHVGILIQEGHETNLQQKGNQIILEAYFTETI